MDTPGAAPPRDEPELRRAMELLFYAYRDFTGEADALLARDGLGRAHHRVLYFVGAHPGLPVGELLDILKVTKQSLARVLGRLLREGYVRQETGAADRRQRRLFLTPRGAALETRIAAVQCARIQRACDAAGPDAARGFRRVLRQLIGPDDRPRVDRAME